MENDTIYARCTDDTKQDKRTVLDAKIDQTPSEIQQILGIDL